MPHVNIKHFPKDLTGAERARLADAITAVVVDHFAVPDGVVSVALEPVERADWDEQVVGPEIRGREELLIKPPNA